MAEWTKREPFHVSSDQREVDDSSIQSGRVAEWFKAHAWKACGAQALAGSNPVSSALNIRRILGKDVYGKPYRGFESPSLRSQKMPQASTYFLRWKIKYFRQEVFHRHAKMWRKHPFSKDANAVSQIVQ